MSFKSLSFEMHGHSFFTSENQTPLEKNHPRTVGAWRLQNNTRFNLIHSFGATSSMQISLDVIQGFEKVDDPLLVIERKISSSAYRLDDLKLLLASGRHENSSLHYYLTVGIDRLNLHKRIGKSSIRIGRQPIVFGLARIISSTNVIMPLNLQEVHTADSVGVDAIRLQHPIGPMGELDLGVIVGNDLENQNSSVYGKVLYQLKQFEIAPLFIRYREANALGLEGSVNLLDTIIYADTLATSPQVGSSYIRTSLGNEQQWSGSWKTILEYHFNGAGEDTASNYIEKSGSFAHRKGGVFLLGRHYINSRVIFAYNSFHSYHFSYYQNLNDDSNLFQLAYDYSLTNNWMLNLEARIGHGDESDNSNLPQSEFGLYGKAYILKGKYYF